MSKPTHTAKIPVSQIEERLEDHVRILNFALYRSGLVFEWDRTSHTDDTMEFDIELEFPTDEIEVELTDVVPIEEYNKLVVALQSTEEQLRSEQQITKRLTELTNKPTWWKFW